MRSSTLFTVLALSLVLATIQTEGNQKTEMASFSEFVTTPAHEFNLRKWVNKYRASKGLPLWNELPESQRYQGPAGPPVKAGVPFVPFKTAAPAPYSTSKRN